MTQNATFMRLKTLWPYHICEIHQNKAQAKINYDFSKKRPALMQSHASTFLPSESVLPMHTSFSEAKLLCGNVDLILP